MLDYIEKRDYIRMEVDCPARLNFEGIEPMEACVKDLSATGLLIWLKIPVQAGSVGSVSLVPGKKITPPLNAEIEVIRCEPAAEDPQYYSVACSIKTISKVNAA